MIRSILFWDDTERNVEGASALGIQAKLYTTYEDFLAYMNEKLAT